MSTAKNNTIEADLRALIAGSAPGARLPSVRTMQQAHRVSPVTVQRIIATLEREGLVDARPGSGTFVRGTFVSGAGRHAADFGWQTVALGGRPAFGRGLDYVNLDVLPGVIPLATGYPDPSLQALGLLATAGARAARRPDAWSRIPTQGLTELRSWFAADLQSGVRAADVLIVSGGQAALALCCRTLASPGEPVVVELPTYVGALEAAALSGLTPIPVPTDEDGIRPDLLDAALGSSGARLLIVQPTFANPTGATWTASRRAEVLAVVRRHGAFAVEDDYARDLAYSGDSPRPLAVDDADGHVVYIRSLTKSVAPGLRIAGVTARGPAMQRLSNTRLIEDFFVPGIVQQTALDVITSTKYPRHLNNLRRALKERMATALAAVERTRGVLRAEVEPQGGVVLWLRLPDHADDAAVVQRARELGVQITSGSAWCAGEPDAPHVRVSIAVAGHAEIASGIAAVADAALT